MRRRTDNENHRGYRQQELNFYFGAQAVQIKKLQNSLVPLALLLIVVGCRVPLRLRSFR